MTKLKKGDLVLIIAGKDRGKTGSIISVLPAVNRVIVDGQNAYKKHIKATVKNPQGGVITAYRSIHASNVMVIESESQKPTRLGIKINGQGKQRISRLTGKALL